MHGDYSRDSYDATKQFARVLMQQGRLIVDADWNEQSAILLQQIRNLTTDLIGWHGGPGVTKNGDSSPKDGPLAITLQNGAQTVEIKGGRYYIDGIPFEWPKADPYNLAKLNETLGIIGANENLGKIAVLVYADIHERLVVSAEDPELLDPGLNGLDTMARQEIVGRPRGMMVSYEPAKENEGQTTPAKIGSVDIQDVQDNKAGFLGLLSGFDRTLLPNLKAFTKREDSNSETCDPSDNSGFSGFENQLYRIEVHTVLDKKDSKIFGNATFKWSRDNGSIVYAGIRTGNSVTLKSKWRDDSKAIQKGNYVELIAIGDDFGDLVQVTDVIENDGVINLRVKVGTSQQSVNSNDRPVIIRRWDHQDQPNTTPIHSDGDGGFTVARDAQENKSIEFPIEDGLFVQLDLTNGAMLKPGDHWLIPARSSTGDILWPRNTDGNYRFVPARSIEHHYAPIALLVLKDGSSVDKIIDLRRNMTVVS
jgi:hypothetical protein